MDTLMLDNKITKSYKETASSPEGEGRSTDLQDLLPLKSNTWAKEKLKMWTSRKKQNRLSGRAI